MIIYGILHQERPQSRQDGRGNGKEYNKIKYAFVRFNKGIKALQGIKIEDAAGLFTWVLFQYSFPFLTNRKATG
jgi:hypothetical protein